MYQQARNAACGLCDAWYAWLALGVLATSSQARRLVLSRPFMIFPLLGVLSLIATCGMFEAQPRYFVIVQCFWAVLAAAVMCCWAGVVGNGGAK